MERDVELQPLERAARLGYLLTNVLKRDWGFQGVVMSDWGGVHGMARTINAGNDLETPIGTFLFPTKVQPAKVQTALERGQTTPAQPGRRSSLWTAWS